MRRCAVGLLFCLVALAATAQQQQTPPPPETPKLALVLSGGGARGAAHIGVLKVLEELHIRPDLVVGTSMGSIVGGLYAAGWSPDEIEELLVSIDWNEVFRDRVERDQRTFRRKQDDEPYLIQTKIRFKGLKPYIPGGALGGQSLELLLRSLEMQSDAPTDFDRLPIPYRAVAMDIVTGEPVVISRGSLATAMRASMSIPGAFPPVSLEGRSLVDGGSAANLPVGIAQQLGAGRIIAVDISSPLTREGEVPDDFFAVYMRLSSIMTVANRVEDSKRLGPGDVLIVPELGDITFVSFERAAEAVGLGESAARAQLDALRSFAADDERWREFEAHHRKPAAARPVIDEVRLVNTSPVSDAVILAHLDIRPGEPLDHEVLRDKLLRLYNLEYFDVIRDRIEEIDGRRVLVIETPPKPHGRNIAQLGVGFVDDFEGDAGYALTVRHQMLAVNRRGGEWQNVGQLGDRGIAATSFYQPLDPGMRWFVQPGAFYYRFQQPVWSEGEALSEYVLTETRAQLDIGRVLGNWGELRLTSFYSSNDGETRSGIPIFGDVSANLAGVGGSFRIDTRNATIFPTRGWDVRARYQYSLDSLGSEVDFQQAFLAAQYAFSFGAHTVAPYVEFSTNADKLSAFTSVNLGGLGRLSGLGTNELVGRDLAFARLRYQYRLARVDLAGIRVRLYAGATFEAGNVFNEGDPVTWDSLRQGGSVFLGAVTPIGPLYLVYGQTDGGRDRVYFAIGESY
jgi:NTE family protein